MNGLDKEEFVRSSKVYNDIELRNKLLETYLNPIKTLLEISGIFLAIPLILTIILRNSSDIKSVIALWGFFSFIWLLNMIYILSLRRIAKKIQKDNSPLLCYESKINKIYKESHHVNTSIGYRQIKYHYYIDFENNNDFQTSIKEYIEFESSAKFEISKKEYKKCLKNNVKYAKVYLFEELFLEKNQYHLQIK